MYGGYGGTRESIIRHHSRLRKFYGHLVFTIWWQYTVPSGVSRSPRETECRDTRTGLLWRQQPMSMDALTKLVCNGTAPSITGRSSVVEVETVCVDPCGIHICARSNSDNTAVPDTNIQGPLRKQSQTMPDESLQTERKHQAASAVSEQTMNALSTPSSFLASEVPLSDV